MVSGPNPRICAYWAPLAYCPSGNRNAFCEIALRASAAVVAPRPSSSRRSIPMAAAASVLTGNGTESTTISSRVAPASLSTCDAREAPVEADATGCSADTTGDRGSMTRVSGGSQR